MSLLRFDVFLSKFLVSVILNLHAPVKKFYFYFLINFTDGKVKP